MLLNNYSKKIKEGEKGSKNNYICVFTQSCPTVCDSMDCSPPGKNTRVGCPVLLQGSS